MIITILAILSAIIGIILMEKSDSDVLYCCGVISFLVGTVILVICITCILFTQVNREVYYQNTLYKREVLEYRLENTNDNIVGNEMLYNDIVEFNNCIRNEKKWANNLWTNWFWNKKIATIDYIEFME